MISDISSVQAVLLSSQLKEILKNDDFHEIGHGICKPIKLVYHPREPFFIIKHVRFYFSQSHYNIKSNACETLLVDY